MLLLVHVVASAWYAIALRQVPLQDNWLDVYEARTETVFFRLLTSWHWALAQFGPTKMSHVPTNTLERAFAVIVAAVAMVVNPFIISRITSNMVMLENLQREQQLRQ